jgi:hypothetical protein
MGFSKKAHIRPFCLDLLSRNLYINNQNHALCEEKGD